MLLCDDIGNMGYYTYPQQLAGDISSYLNNYRYFKGAA
jgi:hypothetical protein